MSKSEKLAEGKRAYAKKSNKAKLISETKISVYDDESVTVDGPIANPAMFMKVIAAALNTVGDYTAKAKVETKPEKSKLISLN